MSQPLRIDIAYDFRTDAGGKDPDQYSATLRKYHKFLWSKPLPDGTMFSLDDTMAGAYLYHKSELGEFFLASDSVIPTFSGWKRLLPIIEQTPPETRESFRHVSYTIGGMMVFPGNRIDGKPTINGERGFNRKLADRFDLTLECIRRFYAGIDNPLSGALARYKTFFDLFGDFPGYIDFFLLNDLVEDNCSAVKFFTPFDGFVSSPIPQSLEEYNAYRQATVDFVYARNRRIAKASVLIPQAPYS